MMLEVFDDRPCNLGEGPLWHPERQELFWFDITGRRMLSRGGSGAREWVFDEMHSAAGWIDRRHLILASESGLWRFEPDTGLRENICALEADNRATRSNDGRADPHGGFWIGTMGKRAQRGAGAIWRWKGGELRRLYSGITIPNAICFTPDHARAHFTDTITGMIMRVALDPEGWPEGSPEPWLDLSAQSLNPDGAVIDENGILWVAQWGASRVAAYAASGEFIRAADIATPNASCPAFGGEKLDTLFCTSALQGLDPDAVHKNALAGVTFSGSVGARGQREHRVIL